MRASRLRVRIRAYAATLASVIWALAAIAMSPAGAEVALAEGPSAARSAGVVYGGMTSNEWPVVIELTRNGRMVKHVVGAIAADCTQGGSFTFPSTWRYLQISRTGAFKAEYHDSWLEEGAEVTAAETFTGKLNRARTRITGTWRNVMTFHEPDGSQDVCDTGTLRYAARQ